MDVSYPHSRRELRIREGFHDRLRTLNERGSGGRVPPSQEDQPNNVRIESTQPLSAKYLAGFIDGEGSLMITRTRARRTDAASYRARIAVANTNYGIIRQIHRDYGGILANQPTRMSGWKNALQLVWSDGMVEELISSIGPHLRLKRKQADLLLEFIRHTKGTPQIRKNGRFAPHTKQVVDIRESFYRRAKALNAKGRTRTQMKQSASPLD